MVCQFLLYNKVNQLYIYIYPHISSLLRLPPTLPIPPLQVVKKHRANLPVLCSCFPLAIYFTFGSVYMSMPLSHFVPAYPSPSLCPQVHSLHLCHYSCPALRFFFFFLTSLLEYICFTIVRQFLLYNKVNQLYIYIYPHISSLLRLPPTLPIPPLQVVTKHQADLPVLCGRFPLAICFTFGSVYMSMPLSHFVPAYPSPSLCPQIHSLCLRLQIGRAHV